MQPADYNSWGNSELIERIEELEQELAQAQKWRDKFAYQLWSQEFVSIDGVNQHKDGLAYREWLTQYLEN